MGKGKLIILSAPSGAGKTTIAKALLSADLNLEFSISACSRQKRAGEIDGKDYFFLNPGEFKARIEKGEFLEWEEVYPDHFYGTLKSEVQRIWGQNHNVLFDIDVFGGRKIKQIYGNQALALFIQPPNIDTLIERLNSRSSDPPEKIAMRINKATEELEFAQFFDHSIINDELDQAISEALDYIKPFLLD